LSCDWRGLWNLAITIAAVYHLGWWAALYCLLLIIVVEKTKQESS
jgi:hypothetical protein